MIRHAIIIFLFLPAIAHADYRQATEATCRVRVPTGWSTSYGTGIAFGEKDGRVKILTNAHVADRDACQVQFWRRGHMSQWLPAKTVWRAQAGGRDLAVVDLDAGLVPGLRCTPIAPRGCQLPAGTPVASIGCPQGNWPTAWTGHVTRSDGRFLSFVPPPENGRSGSPVFTEDFRQVVGLVAWNAGSSGRGMTSDEIHAAFRGEWGSETGFDVEHLREVGLLQGIGRAARGAGRFVFGPRQNRPVPPGRNGPFDRSPVNPDCPDGRCPLPGTPQPGGGADPVFPTLPDYLRDDPPPAAPKRPEPPKPAVSEIERLRAELSAQIAAIKPCQCGPQQTDQALAARLDKLETSVLSLVAEVQGMRDAFPIQRSTAISHYVVVGDATDAGGWPRIEAWVREAKKVHPRVLTLDVSAVPFLVQPLPQIVVYDTAGNPVAVKSGQTEVESVLSNVSRGVFEVGGF